MQKINIVPYCISLLGVFALIPPYFAYGIIIVLAFDIIFCATIYFSMYMYDLENTYKKCFLLLGSVLLTTIIHLLITAFSPIIGSTISFIIYLLPLTAFTFEMHIETKIVTYEKKTESSFLLLGILNIGSIIFILLREFFSFSSISYPTKIGIVAKNIPVNIFESISFVGSTIPGILLLIAFLTIIIQLFYTYKKSVKEEENS